MFAYNQVGGGAKKSRRSPAQLAWRQAVGGAVSKSKRRSRSSSPISRGSTVTLDRARQILREYYAKHGSLQGLRNRMVGGAKHSTKRKSSPHKSKTRKSKTRKSSPRKSKTRKSKTRKSKTRKSKTRKSSTRKSSQKKRKSPVKRRSPKPWYRL